MTVPAQTQTQETEPQQVTQNDPLDDLVASIEENLDPDGHIPPNQEPAPQEPSQVISDPEPPETELEPPQHWSEEHKETFRAQTPEARKFLLDRHRAMEGDYTSKTQTLAQQAQAVAGLQGLGARLQQDPNFRQHMQSYFQQQVQPGPGGQPESTAPGTTEEVDPITAIEERAATRAYERIKQEQHVQARRAEAHDFERAYNFATETKAKDPLSQHVMERLNGYVQAQKHPIRIQETLRQLDQNPFFFNEMYRVMREEVVAEQSQPPEAGNPQAPRTDRRTVAPNLERGGGAPITTSQAKARKRRSEMKNEALRSGTTEALGEFLDSAGLIDSLL